MGNKWYKLWRCLVANLLYLISKKDAKKKIDADVARYLDGREFGKKHSGALIRIDYLLLEKDRTFRSVFYYRCKAHKGLCGFSKIFLPSIREIEIYGKIGEGLCLSHNYMVVHPNVAGKNLRVDAGVVIGTNNGQFPTIGDNVYIGANSTVIGGITIGDNVTVEAGSVVTKNLDSNAVYGGNPAVFVRAQ